MSKSIVANGTPAQQASRQAVPQHVALYIRVSCEDQAERGTIGAQRDFLRQFAQLYQLPVAEEYADDGVTGTIPLGERPDGQRLLQDAGTGRFGCVLVYRVDRLGRSLAALLDAHTALSQAGITIRSATEPFDTSTPIGTFLFQLLGSLAELEKSTISERMTLGRDRVARTGRWTGGPIPFGYDLDAEGRLVPSTRMVEGLAMTEAEVARDIFVRLAEGSTAITGAKRLNAFSVPTARRYGGGTTVTVGAQWLPSRIHYMARHSVYIGRHVFKSKHGTIERDVPALIEEPLWERARAQLHLNRSLPKNNATRLYLLRGLITCGACGATYVGTPGSYTNASGKMHYYRCGAQLGALQPNVSRRCHSKILRAEWIEQLIWRDCRAFILDPGKALAEAQQQLDERLRQIGRLDGERHRLQQALAEKAAERDRVMTLFRRGRATLGDTEAQLDAIEQEAAALRTALGALRAQQDLAEAFESHYTEATTLLTRLRDRLEEVERNDDVQTKRQVIELLVAGIRVDTEGTGRHKQANLTIIYTFVPQRVVDFNTSGCTGRP